MREFPYRYGNSQPRVRKVLEARISASIEGYFLAFDRLIKLIISSSGTPNFCID